MCVVNAEINKQISVACHEVLSHDPADWDNIALEMIVLPRLNESTPITAQLYVSAHTDGHSVQEPTTSTLNGHIEGGTNEPTTSSLPLHSCSGPDPPVTPSDYLCSHCPLCFGAVNKAGDSKL